MVLPPRSAVNLAPQIHEQHLTPAHTEPILTEPNRRVAYRRHILNIFLSMGITAVLL